MTIVAWLYIAAGVIGGAFHLAGPDARPFRYDTALAEVICLAAIVSGAFMLRAHNWARWLALAWMAFHVVLSVFHSASEAAIHALFLAILTYLLIFRPGAASYFRGDYP